NQPIRRQPGDTKFGTRDAGGGPSIQTCENEDCARYTDREGSARLRAGSVAEDTNGAVGALCESAVGENAEPNHRGERRTRGCKSHGPSSQASRGKHSRDQRHGSSGDGSAFRVKCKPVRAAGQASQGTSTQTRQYDGRARKQRHSVIEIMTHG